MKIGILTFHRAINYGAVMQAFSLQQKLQNDFPNDSIEIIDYNCKKREWFKLKCPLIFMYRRSLKEGVQKIVQTKIFNKALKKLVLSESLISVSNKKVDDYITKHYDVVIVGSDAVFNWKDLGLPNPYFLKDVKNKFKLSYAASSHLQNFYDISNKDRTYLQEALNDFQYIGVRDDNTNDFVKMFLNNKNVQHNCDPTIFLDMKFDQMDLIKKLKKHKFDFSKKTIFIMLMKSDYAKYVRRYFGDEYQIVALMDGNKYADKYLYDLNPFEWAKVFKYGSFLITDYFHGTIMGLKNGIPVLSIDSSGYGKDGIYESKAYDLLYKRLELPELYIRSDSIDGDSGYNCFTQRIKIIDAMFDANIVKERIEKEAENYNGLYNELIRIKLSEASKNGD